MHGPAKVRDLEFAAHVEEQILRLDVPVDHVVRVAVVDRAQQLPQALLDVERVEAVGFALQVLRARARARARAPRWMLALGALSRYQR